MVEGILVFVIGIGYIISVSSIIALKLYEPLIGFSHCLLKWCTSLCGDSISHLIRSLQELSSFSGLQARQKRACQGVWEKVWRRPPC